MRSIAAGAGIAMLGVLTACTVEMGPPPDSDPPLVQESQKQPPPPAQPTEPQAWSRDLDFDGGEKRVRSGDLAEGLVGAEQVRAYSGEQLTFKSAEFSNGEPTEAELIRERARKRMEAARSDAPGAAKVAPPEVVAAPVESVTAEALPAPNSQTAGEAVSAEASVAESAVAETEKAPAEPIEQPPVETVVGAAPEGPGGIPDAAEAAGPQTDGAQTQTAALQTGEEPAAQSGPGPAGKLSGPQEPGDDAGSPAIESWDPPDGTILVQVSAIQERQQIVGEWERLKKGYPGVLGPLRLVVEEAKLGERGVFFRVQAGGFDSQEAAESACEALTGQGQPCFVLEKSSGG